MTIDCVSTVTTVLQDAMKQETMLEAPLSLDAPLPSPFAIMQGFDLSLVWLGGACYASDTGRAG